MPLRRVTVPLRRVTVPLRRVTVPLHRVTVPLRRVTVLCQVGASLRQQPALASATPAPKIFAAIVP